MDTRRRPAPVASSPAARAVMQGNRGRDTRPEIALRRALHRRGLRYRVDRSVLPNRRRRADVVFTRARVIVFVDGCFWHCCPAHGTQPSTNSEYWSAKLARNTERDRDTDQQLRAAGWRVIRVWEHEDIEQAASRIARFVREDDNNARRNLDIGNLS